METAFHDRVSATLMKRRISVLIVAKIVVAVGLCVGLGLVCKKGIFNYMLVWKAYTGDYNGAAEYLGLGADVNAKAFKGLNAMEAASYRGDASIVRLLLASGADPNDGIWGAVVKGHTEVVRALVNRGVAVNRRHGGATALGIADARGYHEIAAILKAAGGRE
jgi:ankyrin repeat protein